MRRRGADPAAVSVDRALRRRGPSVGSRGIRCVGRRGVRCRRRLLRRAARRRPLLTLRRDFDLPLADRRRRRHDAAFHVQLNETVVSHGFDGFNLTLAAWVTEPVRRQSRSVHRFREDTAIDADLDVVRANPVFANGIPRVDAERIAHVVARPQLVLVKVHGRRERHIAERPA